MTFKLKTIKLRCCQPGFRNLFVPPFLQRFGILEDASHTTVPSKRAEDLTAPRLCARHPNRRSPAARGGTGRRPPGQHRGAGALPPRRRGRRLPLPAPPPRPPAPVRPARRARRGTPAAPSRAAHTRMHTLLPAPPCSGRRRRPGPPSPPPRPPPAPQAAAAAPRLLGAPGGRRRRRAGPRRGHERLSTAGPAGPRAGGPAGGAGRGGQGASPTLLWGGRTRAARNRGVSSQAPGTGLETAPSFLLACRHAPLARTDPRHGRRRRVYPLNECLSVAVAIVVFVATATATNAAEAGLENISGLVRLSPQPPRSQAAPPGDWLWRGHVTRRARDGRRDRPAPGARRSFSSTGSFPSRGAGRRDVPSGGGGGAGRNSSLCAVPSLPPRVSPPPLRVRSPRREGEPKAERGSSQEAPLPLPGQGALLSLSAATVAVDMTGNFWKWRRRRRRQ
nr:translation initiation factor IF-2-like [Equus asinus]